MCGDWRGKRYLNDMCGDWRGKRYPNDMCGDWRGKRDILMTCVETGEVGEIS